MPTITPLPTPPSRQDPANFSARADAFLAALPTMVDEFNAATPGESAASLAVNLASPASGNGASLVAIQDVGSYFAGATVEAALQEAGVKIRERVSVVDFGITADGVTDWDGTNPGGVWTAMLAASLTKVVVFPPGYYATGMNLSSAYSGARFHFEEGAVLGGVFHLISDASPTQWFVSTISRASNVVTVTTTSPHGWSSGKRVRVSNVYVAGVGSVDFNTDDATITVTGVSSFTYPQTGPNESGTVSYGALVAPRPIQNVVITGRLTTTDRFGTINAKNCYAERVWVKSDTTKHSAYPGTTCRGAHIYAGTENLHIGELIIDDASGSNTDAALAIDGNGWNPKGISIGRCHIKDSDYHGAYITGGGHCFGELRIDGFARGVYVGTLQDSDGATQSQNLKGLWLNRCWDTTIGVLKTSQVSAGSRGYELNHAVIDETGLTTFGSDRRGIQIGTWLASNVRRSGITFGDRDNNSARCNATVGLMEVRLDPAGLSAGEFAVRASGASGGSRVSIDTLRLIDLGANAGVWTETTADLSIRRLEVGTHADRVLQARGRVTIQDIHGFYSGSSSANPLIHFSNAAVAGSYLGNVHLEAASAVTTRLLQSDNGAGNWDVGKIHATNFANATGTIWIDGATRAGIHTFGVTGPSSTGVGVGFNGTVTDFYLGPGVVAGFSKGFAKGTATFTRCTGVGLNGTGNTTATDLTNGSVAMVGCSGVTL